MLPRFTKKNNNNNRTMESTKLIHFIYFLISFFFLFVCRLKLLVERKHEEWESERVCMCAPMVENTMHDYRMQIVSIARNEKRKKTHTHTHRLCSWSIFWACVRRISRVYIAREFVSAMQIASFIESLFEICTIFVENSLRKVNHIRYLPLHIHTHTHRRNDGVPVTKR